MFSPDIHSRLISYPAVNSMLYKEIVWLLKSHDFPPRKRQSRHLHQIATLLIIQMSKGQVTVEFGMKQDFPVFHALVDSGVLLVIDENKVYC